MSARVRDLMSTPPVSVRDDAPLTDVCRLLEQHGIRHLAVLDAEGDVVGVLTDRDLQGRALGPMGWLEEGERHEALGRMSASLVMTDGAVTVAADAPLVDAARTLVGRRLGCLPVVDAGRLVGMLTEGDFVRFVARAEGGAAGQASPV